MKTLVTGGSGLVGSTIESDYKPTRNDLNLMELNSIVDYLVENDIDSIIHCAAKVGGIKANSEHLGEFYYENIIMNSNVLEAARLTGIKKLVSFMSTCVFPDDVNYPLSVDQIHNGEPHPSNYAYAYAKRMLEVQSRAYRKQYGCNFVTVIPCNIYGPRDNYNLDSSHVIPALIHKCYHAKLSKGNFELWGTGSACREFIYSEDVGKIVQWVLENYSSPEPLVISTNQEISITEVAHEIIRIMKYEGNVVYNGERDGIIRKPSDSSKLERMLPDFNFTPINEGLRKSIDWFNRNIEKDNIRL